MLVGHSTLNTVESGEAEGMSKYQIPPRAAGLLRPAIRTYRSSSSNVVTAVSVVAVYVVAVVAVEALALAVVASQLL